MYYSIDDIETEGQRIPSTFAVTVPKLGHLSGSRGAIEEGTKAALPFWMAGPLSSVVVQEDSEVPFVILEEPKPFSEDVINSLKSDPLSVDLREQSPVFTNLALAWLALFDNEELADVLYASVQQRSAEIHRIASSQRPAPQGLDEYEKQLFKTVYLAYRDLKRWQKIQES